MEEAMSASTRTVPPIKRSRTGSETNAIVERDRDVVTPS